MKPIIGVVPLVDEDRDSLWMVPGYMNGIREAGGIPVIFPLTTDAEMICQLLDHVQGVLLTGGHDVNPEIYGEKPIPECGMPCDERDRMEKELVNQALERDMPVLGICRGIQFLNACLGGTLYQDLPSQHPTGTEHHQKPPYDVPIHKVKLMKDSSLYRLIKTEQLEVNSYHHQAIKDLSDRLKCMAVSEDGIIEAVEMSDKSFAWALQWHPEFAYTKDPDCRKIFEEFVRKSACRLL